MSVSGCVRVDLLSTTTATRQLLSNNRVTMSQSKFGMGLFPNWVNGGSE